MVRVVAVVLVVVVVVVVRGRMDGRSPAAAASPQRRREGGGGGGGRGGGAGAGQLERARPRRHRRRRAPAATRDRLPEERERLVEGGVDVLQPRALRQRLQLRRRPAVAGDGGVGGGADGVGGEVGEGGGVAREPVEQPLGGGSSGVLSKEALALLAESRMCILGERGGVQAALGINRRAVLQPPDTTPQLELSPLGLGSGFIGGDTLTFRPHLFKRALSRRHLRSLLIFNHGALQIADVLELRHTLRLALKGSTV